LFAQHGYAEVETPLLEHNETFVCGASGIAQEQMWKTFDRGGRALAIRPDNTMPVLRLAAAIRAGQDEAQGGHPLRLCYVQDVVAFPTEEHPRFCQATQAGVELLGDASPESDAEALALAIQALERSGLRDFQIDIGETDFFAGLMEEMGLCDAERERVRVCVEQKDMLALELMLRQREVGGEIARRIMRLPMLYGGEEVLEQARGLTGASRCLAALERIRRVLELLEAQGLKRFVSIDLGMVQAIHYYTGVIFRGMSGYLGKPLLSGGRYDALPIEFGLKPAAVGFALDVTQTLLAMERQRQTPRAERRQDVVTIALAKGRLAEQAMTLLEDVGVDYGDARDPGRKLVFEGPDRGYRFILVKPSDVPTYVEHGVADIGVAGKDTLLEENRPLYELLDLGFGACRLCVAGFPDAHAAPASGALRVATKYPNIARS
jgi:ATP phosphoribosyltransferase regulatory subunit